MKTAIVDDDPIVCQSLATILAATGAAEVLWTANNGTDAVERYRSGPHHRPDVLLLDAPTNHLSMALGDDLLEGLETSSAAVVIATHDRQVLRRLSHWPRLEVGEALA